MHYGKARLQNTAGYLSTFGKGLCEIPSGNHTISGRKRGNLYIMVDECNAFANASELQVESELQQAELPTASTRAPSPEVKERRKGRRREVHRGSDSTTRTEDSL